MACGSDQLCAGLSSGIEGAIHAMNSLFMDHQYSPSGWGVLMVDASNAFNSLNRTAMLLQARVLWPRCARFLFNTYRGWSMLVVRGSSEFLYSKEGVTQGDPLSMFMYAIGTLPLIHSLRRPSCWTQVWYADDASAGGSLSDIRDWFSLLCSRGPSYGYFPEPSKSLVVVDEHFRSEAESLFQGLGVRIVSGHRYLGGFIGDLNQKNTFVQMKVDNWVKHVHVFSDIAAAQPQLAYVAVARSLQHEWTFLLRVLQDCGALFRNLEIALASSFLPAIFGVEVSSVERDLFSLPLRMGGLGISNPVSTASHCYSLSTQSTTSLVTFITGASVFELDNHIATVSLAKDHYRASLNDYFHIRFDSLFARLDSLQQRAVLRAKEFNLSGWLAVLPLARDQFDLSPQEFRDALALRYRKPMLNLPGNCDGCGATFTIDHALDCRFGGLVTRRHNEVRDAFGDLSSLVWGPVHREPIVREASDDSSALKADLAVRGVWQPQCDALFDIRVVDTDAPSYRSRTPPDVLRSAESDKKKKYLQACQDRRAAFTPLCVSVDGLLGKEADFFIHRICDFLCDKWEKPFSIVMNWIRARLSFAILRATLLCVRGSRTKWRCLGITDGASLPLPIN